MGCIHQMWPCSLLRGSLQQQDWEGVRTIPNSYRGQSLPKCISRTSSCGSSVTCQERIQMPLPRPQTPAGHSTLQDLIWGHLLWAGNFLLLVLCLKIKCLSSSEQLGHGAPSPRSCQGAAGISLQALRWRCSDTNINQTSLLQHSQCHGASQTPTTTG